jgi:uncharacterized protein
MKLQTYLEPADFLNAAQPFMEERETANNLILGVTLRLKEKPEWTDEQPYLAVVQDEEEKAITLAAAITPPHNLLLAYRPEAAPAEVEAGLQALAANLQENGWSVPGVIAESELSRRFAQIWAALRGKRFHVETEERVYELRQVIPPPHPPSGKLRTAASQDLETVVAWHMAFNTEIFGSADASFSRKTVSRRIGSGDIYLWDDGGPVSMALRTRPTVHGESVGGVYTPPEMRGHGYASACVAAVSRIILDSGKQHCNLFTDLANPTSNSIYQKIGYRPVCDFTVHIFSI